MKRFLACLSTLLACFLLFGCAHPINMNPDLATLTPAAGKTVINKRVGYFIPDSYRTLEVTTPGGGGDKVRYFPYRDLEPGLYKALSGVFTDVSKLGSANDPAAMKAGGIKLVILPEIATTSSSSSAFTWPPTAFGVDLTCNINDDSGKLIKSVKVTGNGTASFDEFKSNFSLASVRASNEALAKLMQALADLPELRK
jgi:hypothetical protein